MPCHQPVNTIPMVVNSDTMMYVCIEVIICQSDISPERLMISQIPSIEGASNQLRWEKECETLPAFGVTFTKPFLLKIGDSKPSKIVEFWTFYMSVFVDITNMVLNSDTAFTCA